MCGLSGFVNLGGAHIETPEKLLGAMNESLRHRGPDDGGIWSDPARGVHLAHRRLSILDLSPAGHQPMRTPRGTTIVYNGEIYNFRELRAELTGQALASTSDTEVLLYLYERHGRSFLDKLNGMFALAIWDPTQNELLLARDRIGIKPLYFTERNGIFAFASEIRALLKLPWVRAELDEEALYHFLTFNQLQPPRTMFRGIYKLDPGHLMVVGRNGAEGPTPFWEVEYQTVPDAPGEVEAMVLDTLRRSVRRRLISDVPVGAFLSGGVDSSAIVGLMAEQGASRIKTYSIGFENAPGYDELEYAQAVSRRFGTEHHERIVSPRDLIDFLPHVAEIFDEPLADPTAIPIYFLSELARHNGSIVALSGDGADEIFLGYRNWMRYVRLYPYYRAYRRLPVGLRRAAAISYGTMGGVESRYEILMRAAADQELFWSGASGFKESVKRDVLSAGYRDRTRTFNSHDEVLRTRRLFESTSVGEGGTEGPDWMA